MLRCFFTHLFYHARFFLCRGICIALLFFSSCNHQNKKNKTDVANAIDNIHTTLDQIPPSITLLDTCPPPEWAILSEKPVNTHKKLKAKSKPARFFFDMPVYNTENGLPLNTILCSYCDNAGNMWFGTDGGGVCRFDGNAFTVFNTANGLANNHVWCITEDSKGNMWFGTHGGGASSYDGKIFKTYNEKNGLVNNFVKSIFEDINGNYWFGTNGGITLFIATASNNSNSKLFNGYQKRNLLINRIAVCFVQDNNCDILCGTDSGVIRFKQWQGAINIDKSATKLYSVAHGLADNYVTSIFKDSHNNLWFATKVGVSLFSENKVAIRSNISKQDKSFINFNAAVGLVYNYVTTIAEDHRGNIWFGTRQGVSCFNGKIFDNYTVADGLVSNEIKTIAKDKQGHLWFSTYGKGVCRFAGKALAFCTTAQGLLSNVVTCFSTDKNENLWIGTNEGLSIYNGMFASHNQTFTNYGFDEGLIGYEVRGIYQDKVGSVWITTVDSGLCKFTTGFKSGTDHQKGDKQNGAGINDNKYYTHGSSIMQYMITGKTIFRGIRNILEDRTGNTWFATSSGLFRRSLFNEVLPASNVTGRTSKNLSIFNKAQGLPDNMIYCMTEDRKGNLWFGTQQGGIFCYDGNRVEAIEKNTHSLSDTLGLKKINERFVKTFTNYSTEQGLGANCVFRIREDIKANIWIATYGGGLCRYNNAATKQLNSKLFLNFTTEHGLADNSVYDFVFDNKGNIVAGTNHGFSMLKGFKLKYNSDGKNTLPTFIPVINDFSNEQLEKYYVPVFEQYNSRTGYPIKDIVNGSMYCDKRGNIWAGGGDERLVRFNPEALINYNKPAEVLIQNIKLNEENICWSCLPEENFISEKNISLSEQVQTYGQKLSVAQKDSIQLKYDNIHFDNVTKFHSLPVNLVLDYKHNHVTFDFCAIEPATAPLVKYQYMLEGYNNKWNPVTHKTTASFSNISEGTYTFKLKALNHSGIWSNPVAYTFKVLPPWYRSKWAFAIYIMLFVVVGRSFIITREKKIRQKTDFEKRITEVEMQALRTQMNPHFIFNSLHAINKYMLDNDKQNASEYLSRFSELMRLILENSRHQEVSLEKDLAALTLYLQLESLRFKNKFTYSINVDQELNPETVLIPPMMLQPFVENAILHGIKTKQNGCIQIQIKKNENTLICVVADNGVGLNHTITSVNNKKHASLALKITEERLHIIAQLKKVKTAIQFTDLKDANGNATGLHVEITLPFEESY